MLIAISIVVGRVWGHTSLAWLQESGQFQPRISALGRSLADGIQPAEKGPMMGCVLDKLLVRLKSFLSGGRGNERGNHHFLVLRKSEPSVGDGTTSTFWLGYRVLLGCSSISNKSPCAIGSTTCSKQTFRV